MKFTSCYRNICDFYYPKTIGTMTVCRLKPNFARIISDSTAGGKGICGWIQKLFIIIPLRALQVMWPFLPDPLVFYL